MKIDGIGNRKTIEKIYKTKSWFLNQQNWQSFIHIDHHQQQRLKWLKLKNKRRIKEGLQLPILLVIGEIQSKTTMRYYYTSIRMAKIKILKTWQYSVDEHIEQLVGMQKAKVSFHGSWQFLKKLNTYLQKLTSWS